MQEFENTELSLKGKIFGLAPVQAIGTINGFPFYFRGRYNTWTFAISETKEIDPVDIQMNETGKKYGFFAEGEIGKESEYLASYLNDEKVLEIVLSCAKEYLKT